LQKQTQSYSRALFSFKKRMYQQPTGTGASGTAPIGGSVVGGTTPYSTTSAASYSSTTPAASYSSTTPSTTYSTPSSHLPTTTTPNAPTTYGAPTSTSSTVPSNVPTKTTPAAKQHRTMTEKVKDSMKKAKDKARQFFRLDKKTAPVTAPQNTATTVR